MNEFLEQFLIECRELVAQATDDLLGLEAAPSDAARLDSAFRAFHTLKGGAGIVEFEAMARAVHATEDLLAEARGSGRPATPALIADALTVLDQTADWLDAIERAGELPPEAEAAAQADALICRLRPAEPGAAARAAGADQDDWAAGLLHRHADLAGRARTLIRYTPDAESFLRGEDPLARIAETPDIIALELRASTPWPPLEELDPFACRLVLLAVSAAPAPACRTALGSLGLQAEVSPVSEGPGLPSPARELIEAQMALLEHGSGEMTAGRLASAAGAACNVLLHLGMEGQAARLERAAAALVAELDAAGLRDAIVAAAAGDDASEPAAAPDGRTGAEAAARVLRVEVERVDALVNLAAELTVAKNALGHLADLAEDGRDPAEVARQLKAQHAALDRLVGELQASVLNVRVLPLRHVFQRFPRLVREMSSALDKPVRLITEGEDTEADKAVVEALFEPLLHVVRNALDHGVGTAAERAAAGKPATASVRLAARRDGDNVVVEVEDDGRGVDVDRVRELAVARGLASAEAVAAMSDAEAAQLIFAPGFSTAREVTSYSGRGVGMDAVRAALERLGGRVALETRRGEGTRVGLILPFTVMMSRVVTLEAGGQMFGLPLDSVLETVRLAPGRISGVGAARAFVSRERTLPLISLAEALGREPGEPDGEQTVIIVTAGGHTAGLQVDRIGGRMDVMLKPLDGLMASAHGIAGATLLGDGQVLLVLDLKELLL